MKFSKHEWLLIIVIIIVSKLSFYIFDGKMIILVISSVILGIFTIKILKKIFGL